MNDPALEGFLAKWRARWPEWRVAEAFVPPAERGDAVAWFALRQELGDAAWAGADPRPGEAKLAWWAEELDGWSRGRRRHPLGLALQRKPLPWTLLAAALPALPASRADVHTLGDALSRLEPFAEAVAGISATLFQAATPTPPQAVAVALLAERLVAHGTGIPLPVQAPLEDAVSSAAGPAAPAPAEAAWARELLKAWPSPRQGARTGRVHAAVLRARLEAMARGADRRRPTPSWRILPLAWRAARRHESA